MEFEQLSIRLILHKKKNPYVYHKRKNKGSTTHIQYTVDTTNMPGWKPQDFEVSCVII